MENNKYVVYFGIIQFEKNNAMCRHADGISHLIEECGYKAILVGVSESIRRGEYKRLDNRKYIINDPVNHSELIRQCLSASDIVKVVRSIGISKIHAFIMADYRFVPMKKMKEFCRNNGIRFVINVMDIFQVDGSIISRFKKIDNILRIRFLYPHVERRIYICSNYVDLLDKTSHTAVIPGVTWNKETPYDKNLTDESIQLTFLGWPGRHCEKEKIDWILRSLYELHLQGKFKVIFAGFEKDMLLNDNPELEKWISQSTLFCGRIGKIDCIELLKESDFSLVIRTRTEASEYGFSTKIGEAFTCCIPVLATNTSDNKKYIINGKNGYICEPDYNSFKTMIKNIALQEKHEIQEMKIYMQKNDPLYYRNFVDSFAKVIE